MKSSFAKPGAKTGTPPPKPPTRGGTPPPSPSSSSAAKASPPKPPGRGAPPAPPRRAPATAPSAEEAAGAVEAETTVVHEQAAPATPPRRAPGRPPGATNKPKTPPAAEEESAPGTELATVSETGLVPYKPTLKLGSIEGDFDQSDLILPQFKVASGMGPLRKQGVPDGMLVVGSGEDWLYLREDVEGNPALGITILRAQKKFFQKTNEDGESLYDLGEMGLMFDTKEEMQAANGSLQQQDGVCQYESGMQAHVALRIPDMDPGDVADWDTMGLFNQVEIEGVKYAVAMWFIRGSTYRETGKKIHNDNGKVYPRDESYRVEYEATAKRIDGDKNTWWIVKLGKAVANSDEVIAYFEENAA